MVYFMLFLFSFFFTNLMNEDPHISHVNDSYYAKTKNKGTGTVSKELE